MPKPLLRKTKNKIKLIFILVSFLLSCRAELRPPQNIYNYQGFVDENTAQFLCYFSGYFRGYFLGDLVASQSSDTLAVQDLEKIKELCLPDKLRFLRQLLAFVEMEKDYCSKNSKSQSARRSCFLTFINDKSRQGKVQDCVKTHHDVIDDFSKQFGIKIVYVEQQASQTKVILSLEVEQFFEKLREFSPIKNCHLR